MLVGRPRGIAHAVAAAFYVLNPYTVIFTGRTSIDAARLRRAAVAAAGRLPRRARAARAARPGWWAAAFALILTSIGGGINGAVVGWMLVGPLVLLIYEPLIGTVRWRDSAVLPGAHGRARPARVALVDRAAGRCPPSYGIDFLQFTEQPRTIWGTNSAPEALRLMAYWTSYIGVGFCGANRPLFTEAGTLLFNPLAVGRLAAAARAGGGGFVWTRRCATRPFLLFLLLVGVAIDAGRLPDRDAQPRGDGVGLPQRAARALHAHDPEGGAAGGDRGGRPARPGRAGWPGRACARVPRPPLRRRAGGRRAGRPGRADRARGAAAGARHRGREAAHLGPHPARLDRRGRGPRPRAAGQLARPGAAGPDLRLLRRGAARSTRSCRA